MSDWTTKRHVVAEGDLPSFAKKVLCWFEYKGYSENVTYRFHEMAVMVNEGWKTIADNIEYPRNYVKYWWPLPEVEGEK